MRKYLLPLLIFCMVIVCVPFAVAAEEAEPNCIIRGNEVVASPDSDVTMTVTIENNPGISGAEIIVSFDERLTLVSAEAGEAFSALTYVAPSYYRNPTIFMWDSEKINDEDIKDGIILELTFHTPAGVEGEFPVTITYESGNIFDKDLTPMELTTVNGSISSISYIPGDADGNGRLNTLDITAIRRYISDGRKTDPNGYNVVINENAADVDGNGRINTLDITMIRRYISDGRKTDPNGYNIVLKPGKMSCEHDLTATIAKAPTCSEPGNIAYWHCNKCNKYFSDAAGATEIAYADIIKAKTGHTLSKVANVEPTYTEPGVKEHWKCGVCGDLFADENGETRITENDTVLAPKEKYTIVYHLYDNNEYLEDEGVENPNQAWYDPEEDLRVDDLEKDGFVFEGWYYGAGNSAKKLESKKITADIADELMDSHGVMHLYAKWTLRQYHISYKDDTYNVNYEPETYTVDKRTILKLPEQKGLKFVGWEDDKGNVFTELPKGTTGEKELTAKWRSFLYQGTAYDDQKAIEHFYYDENTKIYYFVYKLGTLEGIPLENLTQDKKVIWHTGVGETILSFTETVTIENGMETTIGKSISNSVTSSTEWSESKEKAKEKSYGRQWDHTFGAELGKDPLKGKFEYAFSESVNETESLSTKRVDGGSSGSGTEETDESSVTLSYLHQISTSITEEVNIPADAPAGFYAYTKLGKASVYGVVGFNCKTGKYGLTTFSVLEYAVDSHLYFPTSQDLEASKTNPGIDSIPFDVPVDEIAKYIEQNWYVSYDGNGGEYSYTLQEETMETGDPIVVNSMPTSVFASGAKGTLAKNLYTRTGYTFVGWATSKDGEVVYKDEAEISVTKTDMADVLTLYAVWENNKYTITYTADKPGHASSNVENMPVNTPCRYDTPAVLGSAPTLTGWKFLGWYWDPECTNLCGEPGAVKSNLTEQPDGIVPLYGKWEAEKRTITYVSNDGTNRTELRVVDYDSDYTVEGKLFDRSDYAFEGWSIDSDASTESILPGQSYKITQDYTVYAIWENAIGHYYLAPRWEITENGVDAYWETGLNREELIAAGCTELRIDYTIKGKTFETSLSGREKWYIEVKDIFGNKIYSNPKSAFEKHDGDDGEVRSYSMHSVSINAIRDDGTIWVRYDHEGNWRSDWILFYIDVTITAIVP